MTYTMNINTFGLSQYAGPAWLGVAEIAGKTLLLREDGLDEQIGDDDNGTEIEAYLKTGQLDLGDPEHRKFVTESRVHGAFSEDLALTVHAHEYGEENTYDYTFAATDGTENMSRQERIGRGLRAITYSFKLANTHGGTFGIDHWSVVPRVGLMSR